MSMNSIFAGSVCLLLISTHGTAYADSCRDIVKPTSDPVTVKITACTGYVP